MKAALESLDTPGGHMVVCLAVILICSALHRLGVPKMEDLIVGAGAVLFAAMRGGSSRSGSSAPESAHPDPNQPVR